MERCSTRAFVPPNEVARRKTRSRAATATAAPRPPATRKDSIPPKRPPICAAVVACTGMRGQPGIVHGNHLRMCLQRFSYGHGVGSACVRVRPRRYRAAELASWGQWRRSILAAAARGGRARVRRRRVAPSAAAAQLVANPPNHHAAREVTMATGLCRRCNTRSAPGARAVASSSVHHGIHHTSAVHPSPRCAPIEPPLPHPPPCSRGWTPSHTWGVVPSAAPSPPLSARATASRSDISTRCKPTPASNDVCSAKCTPYTSSDSSTCPRYSPEHRAHGRHTRREGRGLGVQMRRACRAVMCDSAASVAALSAVGRSRGGRDRRHLSRQRGTGGAGAAPPTRDFAFAVLQPACFAAAPLNRRATSAASSASRRTVAGVRYRQCTVRHFAIPVFHSGDGAPKGCAWD